MEYISTRPINFKALYNATKEEWIGAIVCDCFDLKANDKLTVYDFGENADLKLSIYKDEDFDRAKDADEYNMVSIFTDQLGDDLVVRPVDDTEDTHVTDGSLWDELNRIWNYRHFGLLY